jgi:hypothetical protein
MVVKFRVPRTNKRSPKSRLKLGLLIVPVAEETDQRCGHSKVCSRPIFTKQVVKLCWKEISVRNFQFGTDWCVHELPMTAVRICTTEGWVCNSVLSEW